MKKLAKIIISLLLIGVSIFILFVVSRYNYLLFHTIIELIAISLGIALFFFAITKIRIKDITKFEILSFSYFFISLIDLLHTLAYKGMGVFKNISANEPTQLWIAARYLEALTILIYSLSIYITKIQKKIRLILIIALILMFFYFSFILLSIFYLKIFPTCYIEGKGLTRFKIISEYIIVLLLTTSLMISKKNTDKNFGFYKIAIILTILSELSFTLYIDVYGFFNMIGHIFKFISFVFIYRYILINIIEIPYIELKLLNKKLEEDNYKLEVLREEAEKASKIKTAFLININHEIKTPINIINGYVEILNSNEVDENKKNILQKIKSKINQLINIFEDIITIAKLEIGEYAFENRETNLKSFINSVTSFIIDDAKNKGLSFNVSIDNRLDKNYIIPENAYYSILKNLLSNAIKFTNEIVQKLNGTLNIESKINRETSVEVNIPIE